MIHGMLIMAFFGLGTMPAMVATGVFARRLTNLVQMDNIRRASGFVVIFLGIWTMLGSYLPHLLMHHHHHH